MPFSTQQTNATTRLLTALDQLREAIWECREEQSRAVLIGLPAAGDFPAPGDLDHLTRPRLANAHELVNVLTTWMDTANPSLSNRKPMDVIVEVLR